MCNTAGSTFRRLCCRRVCLVHAGLLCLHSIEGFNQRTRNLQPRQRCQRDQLLMFSTASLSVRINLLWLPQDGIKTKKTSRSVRVDASSAQFHRVGFTQIWTPILLHNGWALQLSPFQTQDSQHLGLPLMNLAI